MQLSRNFTLIAHFIFDCMLPPILRDSSWFMGFIFRLFFGEKSKYYLTFKDQLHLMSDAEINHYYKLLADTFISRDTDLNNDSVEYISRYVIGGNVLDVACGRGFMSEKLAQLGYQVIGVDIVLSSNNDNINPLYINAEITKLPFPDNYFDSVVCTHTLEHIRDTQQALSEIRRVCKKRLIVVVPCQREYRYTFDLHIHFFPYEHNLRQLVGVTGNIIKAGGDFIYTENKS